MKVKLSDHLEEMDHEIVASQLKLVFDGDYVTPLTYTVDVDCRRLDGGVDTIRVTVPAGSRGPSSEDEFGDVIRLNKVAKLTAENKEPPYAETGLYVGVSDVRLVEPSAAGGCRFTVVNDTPLLCSDKGVGVRRKRATPVALQITGAWGNPHLLDDAVGQVMMFWVERGDVHMSTRPGLSSQWSSPRRITDGGDADEPWAAKDASGCITLVCSRGGQRTQVLMSRDDGRRWREV